MSPISLFKKARNQKLFRAGQPETFQGKGCFMEFGCFDKNFVKNTKKGTAGKTFGVFFSKIFLNYILNEKFNTKMVRSGPFFPKSGQLFQFSKKAGDASPSFPKLRAC